jgi:signal transduction histidine kinase
MLAEGGAATGSGTLFMVPVVVAALFLDYRAAVCVTAAALLTILGIGLFVHSADGDLARRLVLWSAVCALIVVPIRSLRTSLQSSLRDARQLLHRTRTLDEAARELASLTSEQDVLASAVRLAATIASTPDASWSGAYLRRLDLDDVVVEASFPEDGSSWMLAVPADIDMGSVLSRVGQSAGPAVATFAVSSAGRNVGSSPRQVRMAWIAIAPERRMHGYLSIAKDDTDITSECLAQLGALGQLVELALSNLFAHKRLEDQAAAEERRRIARDLHDGLAHELTFIASRTRSRSTAITDTEARELSRSADRALDEARRAISVLSTDHRQGIAESISQTAEDLSTRHGIAVRLNVADSMDVADDLGEDLLRITREAICNAASHGHPGTIKVSLWRDQMTHLVVEDDGAGFDVDAPSRGFGLVSMRERAESLGGNLRIRSAPAMGTRIEVLLP